MIEECRSALLTMLAQKSFGYRETQLSAGGSSDYYIDCRTTTLTAEGGRLAGLIILDLLREKQLLPQAVGGLTLGADPVVCNIAAASAWQLKDSPGEKAIDGFLVRKQQKEHGAGRRIEGFCEAGAPVVIVDDACTTGASIVAAIHAALEAAMQVIGVVCIVEREEANGRPAVEAAALGAPFYSVFGAQQVRAAYMELCQSGQHSIS